MTAKKEDVAIRYPNCGTPGYIAPEVINFNPDHPYDELSDIFSCGVLLHKMYSIFYHHLDYMGQIYLMDPFIVKCTVRINNFV